MQAQDTILSNTKTENNADSCSDDSDDDAWYRSMEEAAPLDPETIAHQHNLANLANPADLADLADDDYYALHVSSESDLIAPENSLVWQKLLRSSSSHVSSTPLTVASSSSSLLLLAQFLFSHIPQSLKLLGEIHHRIITGVSQGEQILADDVAHPSLVLLLRHLPHSAIDVSIFASHGASDSLLAALCNRLLAEANVIQFSGCEVSLADRIRSILSTQGFCTTNDESCVMLSLMDRCSSAVRQFDKLIASMPAGYAYCTLSASDAEIVNDTWAYKSEGSLDRIRSLIVSNVSSAVSCNGKLICWALTYNDGGIGVLHTLPNHRRKGLAVRTVAMLLRKMLVEATADKPPFAFITVKNKPSFELFLQLGFAKVSDISWMEMRRR